MTALTCFSCEHSRNPTGDALVCDVTGWAAKQRCAAFVYEPGTTDGDEFTNAHPEAK